MYTDKVLKNMCTDKVLNNMYTGKVVKNMYTDKVLKNMCTDKVLNNMYTGKVVKNMYTDKVLNNMYMGKVVKNMYTDKVLDNKYTGKVVKNMYTDKVLKNMCTDKVLNNMYTDKVVKNMYPDKLFINNEWVDSKSGKTFETYNPHDGSVIAKVAEGDKADIELAVRAAKAAFHRNSEWRLLDASARGQLLSKFADLVERDLQYLAELETYNNGMLLKLGSWAINAAAKGIRYLASLADKIQGDTIPTDGDVFTYTLKQPVGVCGLILPWNGPINMFISKVATALAAGCTVVVKPAEQTPLTALALAALLAEAGFPAGVVNVVNGYGATAGAALTHHPDVAKISFTGSAQVGKIIQSAAGANNLKRVTLELGGKSPLVIMDDANLDVAVPTAAFGVFGNQGQICIAASRLFVQASIYDKFVEKAVQFAKNITIGHPAEATSEHGPQVDGRMMTKVLGYIEKGKKEGAKLLVGGQRVGTSGFYIQPAVFSNVTDDMTIAKEEIFGPVQSILKFDTLEEVIDRANNTNYGLAAGIFTADITKALQFSRHVEAGTVWVNNYLTFNPQAPFGGFKDSGLGRENGMECVNSYLEVKTVTIAQPKKF